MSWSRGADTDAAKLRGDDEIFARLADAGTMGLFKGAPISSGMPSRFPSHQVSGTPRWSAEHEYHDAFAILIPQQGAPEPP